MELYKKYNEYDVQWWILEHQPCKPRDIPMQILKTTNLQDMINYGFIHAKGGYLFFGPGNK